MCVCVHGGGGGGGPPTVLSPLKPDRLQDRNIMYWGPGEVAPVPMDVRSSLACAKQHPAIL